MEAKITVDGQSVTLTGTPEEVVAAIKALSPQDPKSSEIDWVRDILDKLPKQPEMITLPYIAPEYPAGCICPRPGDPLFGQPIGLVCPAHHVVLCSQHGAGVATNTVPTDNVAAKELMTRICIESVTQTPWVITPAGVVPWQPGIQPWEPPKNALVLDNYVGSLA